MKQTILLFSVLISMSFFNNSMAQQDGFLIDSTRETLTMGYGTYTKYKCYYYYNDFNQLKFIDTYTNKNSFPDTADWQNTGNEYHYYDGQQRVVKDLYQSRKAWETDWSQKSKMEYQYSDTTNIKTSFYWDFTIGNWNNGAKYIDSLKAPGELETSHLMQYWVDETGQWGNNYWVDTVFIQPEMVDSIQKTYWVPGDTTILQTNIILYDYTYYPDTLFIYEFVPSYYLLSKVFYSEDSLTKYNYTYHAVNGIITDTISRKIYHFDAQQREIKYEKADWRPADHYWSTLTVILHEYNENGLLVQYDYQSAGSNARTKYDYNDNNLLWRKIHYSDTHDLTHFSTVYYYYTYTYVGMQENDSKQYKEMLFYPNPVKNTIYFKGLQSKEKFYRIVDVTGRVLKKGKLSKTGQSINVSELIPGYYSIILITGNQSYKGKVIKY